MKSKMSDFKAIAANKESTTTNQAMQTWRVFQEKYQRNKTINEVNVKAVPVSGLSLGSVMDSSIYSGFWELNKVGYGL